MKSLIVWLLHRHLPIKVTSKFLVTHMHQYEKPNSTHTTQGLPAGGVKKYIGIRQKKRYIIGTLLPKYF